MGEGLELRAESVRHASLVLQPIGPPSSPALAPPEYRGRREPEKRPRWLLAPLSRERWRAEASQGRGRGVGVGVEGRVGSICKPCFVANLVRNFLGSLDGVFGTSLKTAAFQIAAWEILYETATTTTLRTDTGTFQITNNSDVRSLENTWPTGLNPSTHYILSGYELRFLHDAIGQDQFMFIPAPVPEPTALAVWASFALGLAGTAVRRRRRDMPGHGPA